MHFVIVKLEPLKFKINTVAFKVMVLKIEFGYFKYPFFLFNQNITTYKLKPKISGESNTLEGNCLKKTCIFFNQDLSNCVLTKIDQIRAWPWRSNFYNLFISPMNRNTTSVRVMKSSVDWPFLILINRFPGTTIFLYLFGVYIMHKITLG